MQTSWQKYATKGVHHLQDRVKGRCPYCLYLYSAFVKKAGKVYIYIYLYINLDTSWKTLYSNKQ